MPLFLKIDCHDDMLESGLIIEEVIDFCKDAKEYGVECFKYITWKYYNS